MSSAAPAATQLGSACELSEILFNVKLPIQLRVKIAANIVQLPAEYLSASSSSTSDAAVAALHADAQQAINSLATLPNATEIEYSNNNGFVCDRCDKSPILGVRWRCTDPGCSDFDLCHQCYLTVSQSGTFHAHRTSHQMKCFLHTSDRQTRASSLSADSSSTSLADTLKGCINTEEALAKLTQRVGASGNGSTYQEQLAHAMKLSKDSDPLSSSQGDAAPGSGADAGTRSAEERQATVAAYQNAIKSLLPALCEKLDNGSANLSLLDRLPIYRLILSGIYYSDTSADDQPQKQPTHTFATHVLQQLYDKRQRESYAEHAMNLTSLYRLLPSSKSASAATSSAKQQRNEQLQKQLQPVRSQLIAHHASTIDDALYGIVTICLNYLKREFATTLHRDGVLLSPHNETNGSDVDTFPIPAEPAIEGMYTVAAPLFGDRITHQSIDQLTSLPAAAEMLFVKYCMAAAISLINMLSSSELSRSTAADDAASFLSSISPSSSPSDIIPPTAAAQQSITLTPESKQRWLTTCNEVLMLYMSHSLGKFLSSDLGKLAKRFSTALCGDEEKRNTEWHVYSYDHQIAQLKLHLQLSDKPDAALPSIPPRLSYWSRMQLFTAVVRCSMLAKRRPQSWRKLVARRPDVARKLYSMAMNTQLRECHYYIIPLLATSQVTDNESSAGEDIEMKTEEQDYDWLVPTVEQFVRRYCLQYGHATTRTTAAQFLQLAVRHSSDYTQQQIVSKLLSLLPHMLPWGNRSETLVPIVSDYMQRFTRCEVQANVLTALEAMVAGMHRIVHLQQNHPLAELYTKFNQHFRPPHPSVASSLLPCRACATDRPTQDKQLDVTDESKQASEMESIYAAYTQRHSQAPLSASISYQSRVTPPALPFASLHERPQLLRVTELALDNRYSHSTRAVRLIKTYEINDLFLRIVESNKNKQLKTVRIYSTDASLPDTASLPNSEANALERGWVYVSTLKFEQDHKEARLHLLLPIRANGLLFVYSSFYQSASSLSETLMCRRCGIQVTNKNGTCSQCRENANSCRQCRNIDYEMFGQSFLCAECGYSRFAQLSWSVTARKTHPFVEITNESQRQETMSNLQKVGQYMKQQLQTVHALQQQLGDVLDQDASGIVEASAPYAVAATSTATAKPATDAESIKSALQPTVVKASALLHNQLLPHTEAAVAAYQLYTHGQQRLAAYLYADVNAPQAADVATMTVDTACYQCNQHALKTCLRFVEALLSSDSSKSSRQWMASLQLTSADIDMLYAAYQQHHDVKQPLTGISQMLQAYYAHNPQPTFTGSRTDSLQLRADRVQLLLQNPLTDSQLTYVQRAGIQQLAVLLADDDTIGAASSAAWAGLFDSLQTLLAQPATRVLLGAAIGVRPRVTDRPAAASASSGKMALLAKDSAADKTAAGSGLPTITPAQRRYAPLATSSHAPSASNGNASGHPLYIHWLREQTSPAGSDAATVSPLIRSIAARWCIGRFALPSRLPSVLHLLTDPHSAQVRVSVAHMLYCAAADEAVQLHITTDAYYTLQPAATAASAVHMSSTTAAKAKAAKRIKVKAKLPIKQAASSLTAASGALDSSLPLSHERACYLLHHLVPHMLALTPARRPSSAELFVLVRRLLGGTQTGRREYVGKKPLLEQIVHLIEAEARQLSRAEQADAAADSVWQPFAVDEHRFAYLAGLTSLLHDVLQSEHLRALVKPWSGKLLSSFITVRSFILQRSSMPDEIAAQLLATVKLLLSDSSDDRSGTITAYLQCLLNPQTSTNPRAVAYVLNQLCHQIEPPSEENQYQVMLRKASTQEEFIRGRMKSTPYSLSFFGGPLMRHIKEAICTQLQLPNEENMVELLVNKKIISLDLPIAQVFQKVHLATVNDATARAQAQAQPGLARRGGYMEIDELRWVGHEAGYEEQYESSEDEEARYAQQMQHDEELSSIFRAQAAVRQMQGYDGAPPTTVTSTTSAATPMIITYRLTGLDGEATEDRVESLPADDGEGASDEEKYQICHVFHQPLSSDSPRTAIDVLFTLLADCTQATEVDRRLFESLSRVIVYVIKLDDNRKAIVSDVNKMAALVSQLVTVCKDAFSSATATVSVEVVERLVDTLKTLLQARSVSQQSALIATPNQLDALVSALSTPTLIGHATLHDHLVQLLIPLTAGRLEMFAAISRATVDKLKAPSGLALGAVSAELKLLSNICTALQVNNEINAAAQNFFSQQVAAPMLRWLKQQFDDKQNADEQPEARVGSKRVRNNSVNGESAVNEEFAALPALPSVLEILAGLAYGHQPTQTLAVDIDVLPLLHTLETASTSSKIGPLAENLLNAVAYCNKSVDEKVRDLRDSKRAAKKQAALKQRERMLAQMGLSMASPTLAATRSPIAITPSPRVLPSPSLTSLPSTEFSLSSTAAVDDLDDEPGLRCMVCQEGYLYKPDEILAFYAFCAETPIHQLLTDAANQSHSHAVSLTTVTHFNIIHSKCHSEAAKADRRLKPPKSEWEGAAIRNSHTLCNNLFPIFPSLTSTTLTANTSIVATYNQRYALYTQHVEAFWGRLGFLHRSSSTRSRVDHLISDMSHLLQKFVHEQSFSMVSRGGGRHSNANLLIYQIQMSIYLLHDGLDNTQRRTLSTYLSKPFPAGLALPASEDNVLATTMTWEKLQSWAAYSLIAMTHDQWRSVRLPFLKVAMALSQKHVAASNSTASKLMAVQRSPRATTSSSSVSAQQRRLSVHSPGPNSALLGPMSPSNFVDPLSLSDEAGQKVFAGVRPAVLLWYMLDHLHDILHKWSTRVEQQQPSNPLPAAVRQSTFSAEGSVLSSEALSARWWAIVQHDFSMLDDVSHAVDAMVQKVIRTHTVDQLLHPLGPVVIDYLKQQNSSNKPLHEYLPTLTTSTPTSSSKRKSRKRS